MINSLSVFFPAYNEQENIEKTVKDALAVLEKLELDDFEIIVVNDGSKDKTAEIVSSLKKQDKRVRLVDHENNKGYGEALKTGFKNAKYPWVAFADSDGQFDFSEINKLLEHTDTADFILGYRLKRADAFVRSAGAFVWTVMAKILLGLPASDYSCGFKLIKKSAFGAVLPLESGEKVTQIEMLVKAKKMGFKFVEVGVHHYPRKFGTQTGASLKVVSKSYEDLFKLWWQLSNKLELSILLGILGLAAFFRFYRLPEYMTFLGDEGRDALVIKRILTTFDLPLIGPVTSIGNMYLGPLYYYMMAISMAIFWLKPEAAAFMVALIGVATVGLIFYLSKEWFGFWSAVVSSVLYAISPITIFYSRSSWNPNPTPFFALLAILGLYKLHQTKNNKWLTLTGIAVAFAMQMHYLASILLPIVGVLWTFEFFMTSENRGNFIKWTLISIIAYLFLMSPLVIFDLKHNFMNYRAVSAFFSQRETTVNLNPFNTLSRVIPIYRDSLIGRYMSAQDKVVTDFISWMLGLMLVSALLLKIKGQKVNWAYLALGVWLLVGITGLALYKQTIYDHYLGFLNPVPYFLLGSLMNTKNKFWYVFVGVLTGGLIFLNLQKSPLKNNPNNQLKRTQEISKYVIGQSESKPFNFALLSKNNYDAAYQFYLSIYGFTPKQLPFEITDQLFVVCEDDVCQPVGHAKYEIAAFGMVKIEKETEVLGTKVYKLIANPSGKPQ